MFYTDDPVDDYERYSAEQESELEGLPRCADCGEPIQQEDAVFMNGEWFCDACIASYRRDIDEEW